jgi:hypothetical protein
MRGVPVLLSVTSLPAIDALGAPLSGLVVVLAGAAAGYGGDRSGRSLGVPCAAAAARRTIVRRARRKLPPSNGETPG